MTPRTPEFLTTARLLLRPWQDSDAEPFAALNADPAVMEHFPAPLTRAESDAMIARMRTRWSERGFGLWAVERRDTAAFIGFVGLIVPDFTTHFTPCVEIGWRLAKAHWGQGFATEGAKAALDVGFNQLAQQEIVSITVPANIRSRSVMTKLGMRYDGEFQHPKLPEGHPLRTHVLYRLAAPQ